MSSDLIIQVGTHASSNAYNMDNEPAPARRVHHPWVLQLVLHIWNPLGWALILEPLPVKQCRLFAQDLITLQIEVRVHLQRRVSEKVVVARPLIAIPPAEGL